MDKAIKLGFSLPILRTRKFTAAFETPYAEHGESYEGTTPKLPAILEMTTNLGTGALCSNGHAAWNKRSGAMVLMVK